ncbi:transcription antitermination factor NusB [Jeotgalibaca sp. MA1X17-3]|uniref:transcription antitermination factor NusB n=1 Tax=Jeotgalibaca sp. MA1X17-3 TaxID=2908211 RepID=UPI001F0106D4|nr:transcription antitermination factor NusB [Jeotgalibaca sp. MA1X17-3]UJF14669.1 transcription antitermination factor NusB [Jeotgalibaca sp. MA1X17-3]
MTFPSLNRHQIREKALQTIFQLNSNEELSREEAIQMALLSDIEDAEEGLVMIDQPYLSRLVDGVLDHLDAINESIRPYLKNWSLERLPKTDTIILQIAVYEMLYAQDEEVPQKVALNEAIELAKEYCDESSRKFINGVLSNLIDSTEKP